MMINGLYTKYYVAINYKIGGRSAESFDNSKLARNRAGQLLIAAKLGFIAGVESIETYTMTSFGEIDRKKTRI